MPNSPVVDTCVLRSANPASKNAHALLASQCLENLRLNNSFVVMTEELEKEWKKHLPNFSRYSSRWYLNMIQRGKIKDVSVHRSYIKLHNRFEGEIKALPNKMAAEKRAMLKDLHLFVGALRGDNLIISYNNKDAAYFRLYISDKRLLKINWVNPNNKKDIINWIESGLLLDPSQTIKNLF